MWWLKRRGQVKVHSACMSNVSRSFDHRAVYKAGRWAWSAGDGLRSTVDSTRPRPPSPSVISDTPTNLARFLPSTMYMQYNQIFEVHSLGQSSRGKYHYFLTYHNFFKKQCTISRGKRVRQTSTRSASRFNAIPACDGHTDGHTDTVHA